MSELLWPGDHRAGTLMGDRAVLDAAARVEAAWSAALAQVTIAPPGAVVSTEDLVRLLTDDVRELVATDAESTGTPVAPLVAALRERLPAEPATWLHRGLTSQDVLDTALMCCAAEVVAVVGDELLEQTRLLADLAERHRRTPAVARTLTQYAVPTTLGARASAWLTAVLDAHDDVVALRLPAQLGGAAGTMAAAVELAGHLPDPTAAVAAARAATAQSLGLTLAPPWHTVRTAVTRLGDASVRCTDAYGHLANDVLTGSRPEVRELAEGRSGGSSTMPHKANPVLAALLRRAALTAPPLAATLHLAAADAVDERTAGGWHAEWDTLRILLRRTVVAARQATELLRGLRVDDERTSDLLASAEGIDSEQLAMSTLTGRPPSSSYLGEVDDFIDAALRRARAVLEGRLR